MGQLAPALAIADDAAATLAECRQEILDGLTAAQKRLSPKYLYDERGSQLFEEICALPEYYPTRTELGLVARQCRGARRPRRAARGDRGARGGIELEGASVARLADGARQLSARRHLGRPT